MAEIKPFHAAVLKHAEYIPHPGGGETERLMDSAPQCSNIRDILVTFSVLKQLRSRSVSSGVFLKHAGHGENPRCIKTVIEVNGFQRFTVIKHEYTLLTGNAVFGGNIDTIVVQPFRLNPCNNTAVLIGRNIVMVLRRPF